MSRLLAVALLLGAVPSFAEEFKFGSGFFDSGSCATIIPA